MKNINSFNRNLLEACYTIYMAANNLLQRLQELFPGVIWDDFCKKGDTVFWNFLESVFYNSDTPYEFYKAFVSYKDKTDKDYKKNCFSMLYPNTDIPEESFNAAGNFRNCFQFFIESDEKLFREKFSEVLDIDIDKLQNGGFFPVAKIFPKWGEWICSYDAKRYRFFWNDDNDYGIFKYAPSTPFDAFQHFAHTYYTLARIGLESDSTLSDLSHAKTEALRKIYEHYNLKLDAKDDKYDYEYDDDNEISYYTLKGNIDFGIETKKNHCSNYYPKNKEETDLEIKSAIGKKEYEHKYSKRFVLSFYECSLIEKIYHELAVLNLSDYIDYGKSNSRSKLDYIKAHFSLIDSKYKKNIDEISKKMAYNFDFQDSEKYENSADKRNSIEENAVNDNLIEILKKAIAKVFENKDEQEFRNELIRYDNKIFSELMNDFIASKSIENNQLFLLYLRKMNIEACKEDACLQRNFSQKIKNAIDVFKERNGE